MTKSQGAFRTISEVSEWLDTPAHVLRFWESKFTQIKPVKRAGGRRYYRPEDMALLGGIKTLLHDQGLTIKGVQKLLRDQGNKAVMALGPHGLPDVTDPGDTDDLVADMAAPLVAQTAPPRAAQAAKAPLPALVPAAPAFLRSLSRVDRRPNSARAARLAPLVAQLGAIADRMARF
jgi:DNA-binding transcriptional MerR regulator